MVPGRNTSWTLRECGRPGVELRAQSGIATIHKRGVPTRATERIRTVEQPWLNTVDNDMVRVVIYAISLCANLLRMASMNITTEKILGRASSPGPSCGGVPPQPGPIEVEPPVTVETDLPASLESLTPEKPEDWLYSITDDWLNDWLNSDEYSHLWDDLQYCSLGPPFTDLPPIPDRPPRIGGLQEILDKIFKDRKVTHHNYIDLDYQVTPSTLIMLAIIDTINTVTTHPDMVIYTMNQETTLIYQVSNAVFGAYMRWYADGNRLTITVTVELNENDENNIIETYDIPIELSNPNCKAIRLLIALMRYYQAYGGDDLGKWVRKSLAFLKSHGYHGDPVV